MRHSSTVLLGKLALKAGFAPAVQAPRAQQNEATPTPAPQPATPPAALPLAAFGRFRKQAVTPPIYRFIEGRISGRWTTPMFERMPRETARESRRG